jgi:hypothetical protein
LTISSTTRKAGPFTGNGVTVAFPFAFKVFTTADVLAIQAVTATGVETTKALTTDYTVALNPDQNTSPGGTLTMLVAPPAGTTLTLTSQVATTQGVDLTNLGGFYPAIINAALDRLTILAQQLTEKVSRAVLVTISSGTNPVDIIAAIFTASSTATSAAAAASASQGAAAGSAAAAAASAAAIALPLPVTSGGTGAITAGAARIALGVAASGANNDITQLTSLTTALSIAQGGSGSGTGKRIVNVVEATPYVTYSSTGTAAIYDDTIPQIGEGSELMTVTITPQNAANRLRIEFSGNFCSSLNGDIVWQALFQDATANALAATSNEQRDALTHPSGLVHEMAAGTTSATTFRIRWGSNSATAYVNGSNTTRKFGGIMAARLRVTEVTP